MLKINLSRDSEKFLKNLPSKQRRQIVVRIYRLAENPRAQDASLLRGFTKYYRADIGEYRIIYRFSQVIIFVILIGKRNDGDVYRRLGRISR